MNPYTLDISRVRAAFSAAASQYDNAALLQREVGLRMVERLDLVRLQPTRVIDIGCGTGHVTRLLSQRYSNAEVLGVDIASGMIAYAKQQSQQLQQKRGSVEFICADTHILPIPDQSVDLIVSNLMLHWCNDLAGVLQEWQRILKPEGLLMFSVFGPDTLQELRACWAQVDHYIHVHAFWDMHDMGDALVKTKFVNPVIDMEHFTLTYPTARALMRELKTMGMRNITQGRSKGLVTPRQLERVMTAYETYRDKPAQTLPATYEVIYGHAWGSSVRVDLVTDAQGVVHIPLNQVRRRHR